MHGGLTMEGGPRLTNVYELHRTVLFEGSEAVATQTVHADAQKGTRRYPSIMLVIVVAVQLLLQQCTHVMWRRAVNDGALDAKQSIHIHLAHMRHTYIHAASRSGAV